MSCCIGLPPNLATAQRPQRVEDDRDVDALLQQRPLTVVGHPALAPPALTTRQLPTR